MDVNNIVCCGFNKAYSILKDSKKGSLSDANLYSAALFSYQVSVLENHVSSEFSCLTDAQFDLFSQKMQSCCGCCGENGEEDTNVSSFLNACPVCANVAHFVSQPENDGTYIDDDSLILVNYSNGVFSQYFQKIGADSIDHLGPDLNYKTGVYIDNPASAYHGMMAISQSSPLAPYQSTIQIWNPGTSPFTPTFVTGFLLGNINFSGIVFGRIDYDVTEDSIYYTRASMEVYKVSLSTGTVTMVNNSLSGISPSGNVNGYGLQINPVNRKRYVHLTGIQVVAPDSGAIGILDTSNALIKVFPFDLSYPVFLQSSAPSNAIVFDNVGDVYMVSRTNANNYSITQNDVIKLDGSDESYITSFSYDPTLIWVPECENQSQVANAQYYDGSGFITGEKILVLYRNWGPINNTFDPGDPYVPNLLGNAWTSTGTSSRLVAFDTVTGVPTDVITIPDSLAGRVYSFNYNYNYNKIFFSTTNSKKVLAYDSNGLKIYEEECFPSGVGGSAYKIFEADASDRIVAISNNVYPEDNIAIIAPVEVCDTGRVNIINEGIYTFDFDAGEWVGVVQNSNLLQLGNQFSLSATINIPTGYLTVESTLDFQNWSTLSDVTGNDSFTPAQLDAGLVFLNPSDDPFWVRIKINTEDNCTVYGEIIPDPPPAPDFEGVPTSIYRYNSVDFEDLSVGFPTSWSWQFEGGTPLTSTVENPLGIAYNTLGTFDVGLTVTNANGSRSLTKSNYINVIDGYLINYVSGASAAYSLRKVNIAYTGPAILVRRDSDNATLNIGFVGEELDTAALLAFCTLSNGFVQIWYDQSQLGRHATQVVFGEQPQIVSGGVIIETNSKPSVFFDGIDDSLLFTFPFASAPFSTSIVGRQTLNTGARPIITGTTTNNQFTMSGSIAGIIVTANAATDSFPGGTSTAQKHVAYYRNGVSAKSAYENGSVLAIGSNGITNQSVLYTSLSGLAGANRFGGEVQEIIMYDSYKVSSNAIIQTNVNDYYNIY